MAKSETPVHPRRRRLVAIVDENGPLAPGEIYELFRENVESDEPPTDRTIRSDLLELADAGRLRAFGKTRNRVYESV